MQKSIILLIVSSVLAVPTAICSQAIPNCDNVQCGSNQVCQVIPATKKGCSYTTCKDIEPTNVRQAPCPKRLLECSGCGDDEECGFSPEDGQDCPTPICVKKTVSTIKPLRAREAAPCPKRLLECSGCGDDEECGFSPENSEGCPTPICMKKKGTSIKSIPVKVSAPCPRRRLQCSGCGEGEECGFTTENNTCPTPVCVKKVQVLVKRMVCPEYSAPLCSAHLCATDEECQETRLTPVACPKATCIKTA